MAVGDPFNGGDRDSAEDMVFIPSSLPLVSSINLDSLMAHLDDNVYDKSPTSHLRHIIEVLCGKSGFGGLLYKSVRDWLNGGVETAWLGFVDQLFASIYGLPRIYKETTVFNVSDAILTADEVSEALVKEAWYKARFVELMHALNSGGTVKGFRYAVMAICYCDCDIYETWRYKKESFPVGRLGYTLYNEVVICPYNKEVTEQQKELLLRVLDRLKPSETVVTIDVNGIEAYKKKDIRSISASSSYFEVQKTLTNSVDNSKLASKVQMFGSNYAYGYDEFLRLGLGEETEVRKAIEDRTQEYSEYYVYDKSTVSQIASVDYQIVDMNGELAKEPDWTEKVSTVRWSAWQNIPLADCPENYPGGKFGRTPKRAPAVNKDGTEYIFDWNSQAEYEAWKEEQIVKAGGEVKNGQFRYRLSVSTVATTYTPDMSLVSVNDAYNSSQTLPDVQPQELNSYNKVVLRRRS